MRRCHLGNEGNRSPFLGFIHVPIIIRHRNLLLVSMIVLGLHAGCVTSDSGRRTLAFRQFSRHTNKSSLKSAESTLADSQEQNEQAREIAKSDSQRASDRSTPQRASDTPIRNPSSDAHQIKQVAGEEGQTYDPVVDAKAELPDPSSKDYPPVVETFVPQQLTLGDLENLALGNNPTLSQAQAAVTGQEGVVYQAGLYPNPQVGYINSSASNPSVKQSNGAFFAQEFVTANKLGLAQLAASEELRRFQWDNEAQRIRVTNDLKIRYYEVLGSQKAVEVYRELLKISEKSLAIAKSLLANEGTRTDYLQAKVQLETVRLNLDEAELRYAAAWEQLATMVGVSTLNPVPLVGDLTDDIPQLDLETCWQQLLSCSPQLRAAEAELGHGYATLREQQALAIPNVTV
ncbi:MAG: TolC family protein, partial [Schlesneria sp.]